MNIISEITKTKLCFEFFYSSVTYNRSWWVDEKSGGLAKNQGKAVFPCLFEYEIYLYLPCFSLWLRILCLFLESMVLPETSHLLLSNPMGLELYWYFSMATENLFNQYILASISKIRLNNFLVFNLQFKPLYGLRR